MSKALPKYPRIVVPRHSPDRLEGLLELIFPDHRLRQKIAKAFLEEVRRAGREGLPETEWIRIVVDLLENQELQKHLIDLERGLVFTGAGLRRTQLQKEVSKKAEELGLVDEEGHNLFHVYKSQYTLVVKELRRLGLVYKKEGAYHTSPHFAKVLEEIASLWKDWRAGLVG